MIKNIFLFLAAATLLFSGSAQGAPLAKVECIAPAGAGGGWDFTCRVPAAQVMSNLGLVEGRIEVTNMSGAGGGKAFAYVATKRKEDESLIVAASMATATRLGQNVYAGFTADDVRWIGALGADYGVLAVAEDSPYRDLQDLLSALQRSEKIRFTGGSSAGGWDHMKVLIMANKAGIKNLKNINYVSFDNGGKAMLEIISGRADVFTGDTSEVLSYLDADKIRVLAVLSPNRVQRLGETKTAKEQGYDVIGANWRGFYAPKGISDATYHQWTDAVVRVSQSAEWSRLREANGLAPFSSFGPDFEHFVKGQVEVVRKLSIELGFIQESS